MIYRFLFVVLIVFAAGCVQPVVTDTPPAAVSPSPSSTIMPTDEPTLVPSDTATASATTSPTETSTATPSATDTPTTTLTPSATASATLTPTITNTPAPAVPTGTADQVNMDFSPAIMVTFDADNPMQQCLLRFYDVTLEPGFIGVWRRDKGGYLVCVAKEQ